jgi:hypothetical protein
VHGADYVSEKYVKFAGRLGRSHGCPAVSMEVYKQLIGMIKNQTCLFIYAPNAEYISLSKVMSKIYEDEPFALNPKDTVRRF